MEDAAVGGPSPAYTQRRLHAPVERRIVRRPPERHRNAGTGHEREAQFARPVVHPPRLLPLVGELLIDEHRTRTAACLKHPHHLLEVLVARIELLVLLVGRIVAVLADEENAVNSQFAGTERKGLGDSGRFANAIGASQAPPYVRRMKLIHPQRRHLERRRVILFIDPVPFQEAGNEIVRVRPDVIGRGEAGDALSSGQRARQGRRRRTGQELAPIHGSRTFSFSRSTRRMFNPMILRMSSSE